MSGFAARLLVWVKPRKTQHEQIFLAVPPIADILSGLRFGFVNLQQARLLFHNRPLRERLLAALGRLSLASTSFPYPWAARL